MADVENEHIVEEPFCIKIFNTVKNVIFQLLIFYFITSFFQRKNNQAKEETTITTNVFGTNEKFNFYLFLSNTKHPSSPHDCNFIAKFDDLFYMNFETPIHKYDTVIDVPETLKNNGTLYLVSCITKDGIYPQFSSQKYVDFGYRCKIRAITKIKKIKKSMRKNLISGKSVNTVAEDKFITHYHPNVTVNVVYENTPYVYGKVHFMLLNHVVFTPDEQSHFPIIFINDYWNLNKDYKPVAHDNETLKFSLSIQPISGLKWQFYLGMSQQHAFKMKTDEEEDDTLKQILLDTPIYLLFITVTVSIAHSIFEFLAFKNDIQFWKTKNDLTGLSVSNILFGLFQSVIVFLYVLDNDANFLLIVGSGIGCLIDAWKITKVVDISVDRTKRIGPFPGITFADKSTYVESNTRVYDRMALKYLSIVLVPMFICYSVYSLFYNEHKGWYSLALSLIYGFLLTFGFIMMTPQLFINYKLKSVAHLPWRMLTYKALNTFIDDIFAFVIKMPTMYRIGCLRDDVVFFIYLYQRWIYPIDKSRVNEFGTSGEEKVKTL